MLGVISLNGSMCVVGDRKLEFYYSEIQIYCGIQEFYGIRIGNLRNICL